MLRSPYRFPLPFIVQQGSQLSNGKLTMLDAPPSRV